MLEKKKLAEANKKETDPKKAAIAAALERSKKKKDSMNVKSENTENLATKKQNQIDEANKH